MGEVFVLAAPEAVARHHDPAAKPLVCCIDRGQRLALFGREHRADDSVAIGIEARGDALPVERCDLVPR